MAPSDSLLCPHYLQEAAIFHLQLGYEHWKHQQNQSNDQQAAFCSKTHNSQVPRRTSTCCKAQTFSLIVCSFGRLRETGSGVRSILQVSTDRRALGIESIAR